MKSKCKDDAKSECYKRAALTITHIVAQHYHQPIDRVLSESRAGTLPEARMMTWKIMRDIYGSEISYPRLAVIFDKDHSTILHGIKKISGLIDVYYFTRIAYHKMLRQAKSTLNVKLRRERHALHEAITEAISSNHIVHARIKLREILYKLENN